MTAPDQTPPRALPHATTQRQDPLHEAATMMKPQQAGDASGLLVDCLDERRRAIAGGGQAPSLVQLLRRRGIEIGATDDDGARIGPYVLGEVVGAGGMGEVYRARDPELGRDVAIKVLRPDIAEDLTALERFLREARITGQLEHPAIVPVHQLGLADDGRVYIAMKLVRGATLSERLLDVGDDPTAALPRLLEAFARICSAMALAHSRDVIHRDLKPANVMLGEFGEVQVMDWGLAKRLGTPDPLDGKLERAAAPDGQDAALATLDGAIVGTPAYMPPEQARGEVSVLDARSDVYSLGAILYTILTGQAPYEGATVWAVISSVLDGALVPPSRAAPHRRVPWELEAVVLKAMAANPDDRYPSASELEADVRRFLDGRALSAASYSPIRRLGRWVWRNKRMLTAAALSAAIVLGLSLHAAQTAIDARLDRVARARALAESTGVRGEQGRKAHLAWLYAIRSARDRLPGDEGLQASEIDVALRLHQAHLDEEAWEISQLMLDAARRAGLSPGRYDARRRTLQARRTRKRQRQEQETRRMLTEARDLRQRHLYDEYLTRLIRMDEPHVVRLLLVAALDRNRRVAQLAVEALGKIGDAATTAELDVRPLCKPFLVARACPAIWVRQTTMRLYGDLVAEYLGGADAERARLDAVQLLSLLLLRARLDTERDWALALTWALGRLRDERANGPMMVKRDGSISNSEYFVASETPYMWIPLSDVAARETKSQLMIANELIRKGQYHKARSILDVLIAGGAEGDDLAVALIHRSDALSGLKRFREAIDDLTHALKISPKRTYLLNNRGRYHVSLGEDAKALADFERVIREVPDLYEGLFNRGVLHLGRGRSQSAVDDFTRAIAIARTTRGPTAMAIIYAARSRALLLLDRLDEAEADIVKALTISPRDPSVLLAKAHVAYIKGDLEDADATLDAVVRLDPGNLDAYDLRGMVHIENRRYHEARDAFAHALKLDPRHVPSHVHTARLHFEAAAVDGFSLEQCLAAADRALKIEPDNGRALYWRGAALVELRRPQDAIAPLSRAIELWPERVETRMYRGRALARLRRYPGALKDLDVAVKRAPRDAQVRYERASVRMWARDPKGALADAEAVIKMTRPGTPLHAAAQTLKMSLKILMPK